MSSAVTTLLLAGACGGDGGTSTSTQPPPPPPPAAATLTLSTASVDDTIGIITPITVLIRRGTTPVSGADVHLTVMPTGTPAPATGIGPARGGSFGSAMSATTDTTGSVTVFVANGLTTGSGTIPVDVPSLSLHDTVKFTVRAGQLSLATVAPHDTAVFVGNQLALRITLSDRGGNAVPDRADVTDISGLTATNTGNVFLAGPVVTRGRIVLRTSLHTDTVAVTVVPRDTMVFTVWHINPSGAYRVSAVGLDGSVARIFGPPLFEGPLLNPSWSADGLHALSNYGGNYGDSPDVAKLYLLDTTTVRTEVAPVTPGVLQHLNGHFSHAGDWIFFYSVAPDFSTGVWRVRTDGSGLEQLISRPLGEYIYGAYPFPDGKTVLVVKRNLATATNHGYVLDVATHAITDIGQMNDPVSISPQGDQLAWFDNGSLWVRAVAGGSPRNIAPGVSLFSTPPAWTRDGRYVLCESIIVDVTSGAQVPLPWVTSTSTLYRDASARP